ncbi:MAG: TolC family protein [Planctomycetales bacterium]|nr:TolC family protein [Planctomycetales bacterium]
MTRSLTGCLLILTCVSCRHTAPRHAPNVTYVPSVHTASPCEYLTSVTLSDDISPTIQGPQPVEAYIQVAIQQNPELQAARLRVQAAFSQIPVEASLQDPNLTVTTQPAHVQTAAGQQELMIGATQKVPWFGKLDVRAEVARAQVDIARAQLAAAELDVITEVKRAYYELYFLQQAITVTTTEQELLADIRDVANTRYRIGGASQQDVLRAEVEVSTLQNDLISLRQQQQSSRARLARLLHLPPDTELAVLDQLPTDPLPNDLEQLRLQAVHVRPELRVKLAELSKNRREVTLACLEKKPDLTFGVTWIDVGTAGISPIANGRDAVLLSLGSNLPLNHDRIDSAVRSANAKAHSSAQEYDALRDRTVEQVTDLFAKVQSQHEMLTLFQTDIIPKAKQALDVSNQAYNVGQVDFLQLIDNWRQLLRYEVASRRLEADLWQALSELESIVGALPN